MQYINYRESRQRGTLDFPFEYHHVTPSHPQYNMSLHWHVEFELIRILEGQLLLTIDENEYTVLKGSTIIIPAGCVHSGVPKDCTYECIVFDMNALLSKNDSCCKLVHRISDHEIVPFFVYDETYNDIHQIVWCLFDAISSKIEGFELIVLGAFYHLFGMIYSKGYYTAVSAQPTRNHKRIVQLKTALEYMESSYNRQITLEDISNVVNMSPKYFCR